MLHLVVFLFLLVSTSAQLVAAPFSDVIVFGDSLSDVGNLSASTLGLLPGSNYFQGRFSNGPVYAEVLTDGLELGPLQRSLAGGNDFAYGGGRTSGTSFFEGGLLLDDLDEQIDDFLDHRTVDPQALYVVLAGGNDFILGDQTDASIPAGRIEIQMRRLIAAGARRFLSLNLPLLGLTPKYRTDEETATRMNNLTMSFNDLLQNSIDSLTSTFQEIAIYQVDLQGLISAVVAAPSEYSITNTNDEGMSADDPAGYLFWDNVHPALSGHRLIGVESVRAVLVDRLPGDVNDDGTLNLADVDLLGTKILAGNNTLMYDLTADTLVNLSDLSTILDKAGRLNGDADFSGTVDFADFLVVAQNFGSNLSTLRWSHGDFDTNGNVDFGDFLILSQRFGQSAAVTTSVPEPGGHLPFQIGLTVVFLSHRVRRSRNTDRLTPTDSD